jgi:hypothetical protein
MSIRSLFNQMVFKPSENGPYSERWTGKEFRRLYEICKEIGKLIFLEYFSDSTQVSTFGNKSVHPIQVTLGNLPHELQNSKEGTLFVGFLPNFDNYPMIQDAGQKLQIIHNCWLVFFADLKTHLNTLSPLLIENCDKKEELYMPFLGLYRGDTPEIKKLTTIKDINTGSGESPCAMCTVPGSNFQDEKIYPARVDSASIIRNQKVNPEEFHRHSYVPNINVPLYCSNNLECGFRH